MKKLHKSALIGGAVVLWASALVALAQTPTPARSPERVRDLRQETREKSQQIREETRTKAQNVRQEVRTSAQNAREEINAKREELRTELKAKREEAKQKIEAARKEAQERLKAQREEFKKKVEQIRDERKKATATRLDGQLNHLNERWTTHFTNVLNRLEDILGKIQVRLDKAASLGKDVSAARTAIDGAKTAIASARSAVEAQAKKTYTITFTSDEQLRTAFRQAKDQLHKDLTSLRDGAIKSAREAVHQAARALARIPRVDEEPDSTTPPSPSTSTPSGVPAQSSQ